MPSMAVTATRVKPCATRSPAKWRLGSSHQQGSIPGLPRDADRKVLTCGWPAGTAARPVPTA